MAVGDSLTIAGITFTDDGFARVRSLLPLLERGPLVNENTRGQGVDGRTHEPKSQEGHEVTMRLTIRGLRDVNGAAHPAPGFLGVRDNIFAIYDACVEGSKDDPVTCTLNFSDGATLSGAVECPSMTLDALDRYIAETVQANLQVRILAGKLTFTAAP